MLHRALRAPIVAAVAVALASCSSRTTISSDARPADRPGAREGGADLRRDAPLPDQTRPDRRPASDWAGEPLPPGWHLSTIATVDLHAVACVQGEVFAVGDKGTILHHAPGSAGFQSQSSSISTDLYTVSFADLTYGVVAGKHPTIWETRNLGQTWSVAPQCSAFVFEVFNSLHLHAANEGFGAGVAMNNQGAGYKYYSGSSWVCPSTTYPGEVFHDVFRLADSGWIVGATGGKIYRTEDQGMTWPTVSAGTSQTLRGIHRTGSGALVAVGEGGTIVRSTDGGGKIWAAVTSPVTSALRDVHFQGDAGWAVGESGVVLHSKDGGQSWQAQVSPTTSRLEGVCFTSALDGWAVGAGGALLQTTSGGS
jgi:photosystem II stability/assembly factor-like uncharacterized protein